MNQRRGSILIAAIAAALVASAGAARARAEDQAQTAPAAPAATPKATAPAAPAQSSKPKRKKVQEVNPRRLEIQGQIESPRSTFILEAGGSLIPDIGSLDGLLAGPWIPPIDKERLDHVVVATIEKGDRP